MYFIFYLCAIIGAFQSLLLFSFFLHKSFLFQKLDYWWVEKFIFGVDFPVHSLEFNRDGTRLLIGGEQIQLWKGNLSYRDSSLGESRNKSKKVSFDVGDESEGSDDSGNYVIQIF